MWVERAELVGALCRFARVAAWMRLMNGRGLPQTDLAGQSGIAQSTLSAVPAGTRSLTKDQVFTLTALFRVSPVVFRTR